MSLVAALLENILGMLCSHIATLAQHPIEFLFGFEYELDELKLKHFDQNGDEHVQWIAGIVERQTGECKYYRVEARSTVELVATAVLAIPDGSFAYADDLPAYNELGRLHYHY